MSRNKERQKKRNMRVFSGNVRMESVAAAHITKCRKRKKGKKRKWRERVKIHRIVSVSAHDSLLWNSIASDIVFAFARLHQKVLVCLWCRWRWLSPSNIVSNVNAVRTSTFAFTEIIRLICPLHRTILTSHAKQTAFSYLIVRSICEVANRLLWIRAFRILVPRDIKAKPKPFYHFHLDIDWCRWANEEMAATPSKKTKIPPRKFSNSLCNFFVFCRRHQFVCVCVCGTHWEKIENARAASNVAPCVF